jgi:hypothetical protein
MGTSNSEPMTEDDLWKHCGVSDTCDVRVYTEHDNLEFCRVCWTIHTVNEDGVCSKG